MRLDDKTPVISLEVEVKGYEMLSAFPLQTLPSNPSPITNTPQLTPLGLLGKMTGAAALISTKTTLLSEHRLQSTIVLKALGVLGLYVSTLPSVSIADNLLVLMKGKVIPGHTVSISKVSGKVLEIDVEKAWREMELDPGWGNEVAVEVILTTENIK